MPVVERAIKTSARSTFEPFNGCASNLVVAPSEEIVTPAVMKNAARVVTLPIDRVIWGLLSRSEGTDSTD